MAENADKEPYTDQWGTFISGQAPIKNETGEITNFLSIREDISSLKESVS